MPSDLARKKAAKKKKAAKVPFQPSRKHEENGDAVIEPQVAEEKKIRRPMAESLKVIENWIW
jgi:ATP-binding cassette subfamily F protein 2